MKKKILIVSLIVIGLFGFADAQGINHGSPVVYNSSALGSIYTMFKGFLSPKAITYGFGIRGYYWTPPFDTTYLGTSFDAELGLGPLHLCYGYKTDDLPPNFGEFEIHQVGIGFRYARFWLLNVELGAAVRFDLEEGFNLRGYAVPVAIEFPILKFLRTGDYEHALCLRGQSNIFAPLGDIEAGIHFSRNYSPLTLAIAATHEFGDTTKPEKLAGWFDKDTLFVHIENTARMKLKDVQVYLTPDTSVSKLYALEITQPKAIEIPGKTSATVAIPIRSLDQLENRTYKFHYTVKAKGKGRSSAIQEYDVRIPFTKGNTPSIPKETPAGLI